jgi:hypothetical protein
MAFGFGFGMPRSFAVPAFSPASLFANGEQGWWYDPSNFATLFQDSAGTTPVTAVEQPVGLQLDLSKGLVLGPELVVSPYAGTTSGSGWAFVGSTLIRGGASTGSIRLNVTGITSAKTYAISFTVSNIAGDNFFYNLGLGSPNTTVTANGTYTSIRTGATIPYLTFNPSTGTTGEFTISNISVKELSGNHRFQTTSANRPVVSARVNLLTKTEDFTNAAWNKNSATYSGTLLTSTGTSEASVNQSIGTQANTSYTFTVRASKGSSGTFMYVRNILVNDGAPSGVATFNLENGTVVYTGSGYSSATINDAGGGLYDCTVVGTKTGATAANRLDIGLTTSSIGGLTCSVGNSINIYRADLRPTNQGVGLPAYQRVNTSTDYDSTGFPVYIKPNGSNQFMQTNSINFTATDKMTVWQGVRKLSDTARASSYTHNGTGLNSFGAEMPNAPAGNNYLFYSLGSSGGRNPGSVTKAAPVTSVINCVYDIANTGTSSFRIDTVAIGSNSASLTGNAVFTNNPAYFYARSGADLFFSGNDYGSIARGAASTAAQITDGETYINSKTKAYTP